MLKKLSIKILNIFGWKVDSIDLPVDKYVVIGAPHTTNWDFPLALLTIAATGLKFSWAGKDSLFFFPLGPLLKKIGGISVNRRVRNDFLRVILTKFKEQENFVVAIAPEGTRSYTDHWKCGFYQIAVQTGAKIALGYVDFTSKTAGIGKIITPTGNLEDDFQLIREFYQDKTGLYPEKQSKIAVREKEVRFMEKQLKKLSDSK